MTISAAGRSGIAGSAIRGTRPEERMAGRSLLRRGQGLVDIRDDVLDVLDADRQADILRLDAGGGLFLRRQLRVRRAGRVDA